MSQTEPRFSDEQLDQDVRAMEGGIVPDAEVDAAMADPQVQSLSGPFIGAWSQLISTTNWEKGKIISAWREALVDSGASSTAYSDEAWSRSVGGVTSQHVGRLRRVYDRFGSEYASYQGLYWSHFLASLEWEDAEMWLEGAVQSGWSVSQMRTKRWETLGAVEADRPDENEIQSASVDEDFEPLNEIEDEGMSGESAPLREGPDFGDSDRDELDAVARDDDDDLPFDAPPVATQELVSPFASLPELPDDVSDAMEALKLAIVRHRSAGWESISQMEMLQVIAALQAFVNAPAGD